MVEQSLSGFYVLPFKRGKGTHAPSELSIEIYIREFLRIRKSVHYVHDLSEGGLSRGLMEVGSSNPMNAMEPATP